jgi:hypothetical protein
MPAINLHPASFRDPDGFVYWYKGQLYRQVNKSYERDYQLLMEGGLYKYLSEKGWLLTHEAVSENFAGSPDWVLTLQPEIIPFISFPYEWSFDMLKDAALRTLDINKAAIEYGMILKDATPFNIQFYRGRPVLIDTLSFEIYDETLPWNAYKQFCECFLFPLLLCSYTGTFSQKMLAILPEGIPVNTTASLLPFRSRWNINVWLHVFLQRTIRNKAAQDTNNESSAGRFSKKKMSTLLNGLYTFIAGLRFHNKQVWDDYYDATISGDGYLNEKKEAVITLLDNLKIETAFDIGANDGFFSSIVAKKARVVIAADITANCINQLYLAQKNEPLTNILPLVLDIANPSPAIGFGNKERPAFLERIKADMVLALAVIHHLHFSNNLPLHIQAFFFSTLCYKYLLIEFIPAEDEKVNIITGRKGIVGHPYNKDIFETAFSAFFTVHRSQELKNGRIVYLMENKLPPENNNDN